MQYSYTKKMYIFIQYSSYISVQELILDGGSEMLPLPLPQTLNMIKPTMFSFWCQDSTKKKLCAAADGQQHTAISVSRDSRLVNNSEQPKKFYKEAER